MVNKVLIGINGALCNEKGFSQNKWDRTLKVFGETYSMSHLAGFLSWRREKARECVEVASSNPFNF